MIDICKDYVAQQKSISSLNPTAKVHNNNFVATTSQPYLAARSSSISFGLRGRNPEVSHGLGNFAPYSHVYSRCRVHWHTRTLSRHRALISPAQMQRMLRQWWGRTSRVRCNTAKMLARLRASFVCGLVRCLRF
jgi:hypothetical protein